MQIILEHGENKPKGFRKNRKNGSSRFSPAEQQKGVKRPITDRLGQMNGNKNKKGVFERLDTAGFEKPPIITGPPPPLMSIKEVPSNSLMSAPPNFIPPLLPLPVSASIQIPNLMSNFSQNSAHLPSSSVQNQTIMHLTTPAPNLFQSPPVLGGPVHDINQRPPLLPVPPPVIAPTSIGSHPVATNIAPPPKYEALPVVSTNIQVIIQVFREKMFVPVSESVDAQTMIKTIVGEGESNLKYIREETGALVVVRGQGTNECAEEQLHFYIEHTDADKFSKVKTLLGSLAETIIKDLHTNALQQRMNQSQQEAALLLLQHPPPTGIRIELSAVGSSCIPVPELPELPQVTEPMTLAEPNSNNLSTGVSVASDISAHTKFQESTGNNFEGKRSTETPAIKLIHEIGEDYVCPSSQNRFPPVFKDRMSESVQNGSQPSNDPHYRQPSVNNHSENQIRSNENNSVVDISDRKDENTHGSRYKRFDSEPKRDIHANNNATFARDLPLNQDRYKEDLEYISKLGAQKQSSPTVVKDEPLESPYQSNSQIQLNVFGQPQQQTVSQAPHQIPPQNQQLVNSQNQQHENSLNQHPPLSQNQLQMQPQNQLPPNVNNQQNQYGQHTQLHNQHTTNLTSQHGVNSQNVNSSLLPPSRNTSYPQASVQQNMQTSQSFQEQMSHVPPATTNSQTTQPNYQQNYVQNQQPASIQNEQNVSHQQKQPYVPNAISQQTNPQYQNAPQSLSDPIKQHYQQSNEPYHQALPYKQFNDQNSQSTGNQIMQV